MTRAFPKETLVDRLHYFGFPPPCYPSYEALTITSAGLTPAEHASLSWTHNAACGFPALRSPVCFLSRFMWSIFWIYFQHSAMANPIAVKQLQFIIKPLFTPLFPAEAPAIPRSPKMPPNFLFNPIFDKAKGYVTFK
jgi:hypothetical protein